jgi:hypothetical protein
MATTKGIVRLQGKLGNIVVYELNGKLVARSVPAAKKKSKAVKHSYAKRSGRLEFSAASLASKEIRSGLAAVQHTMGSYVTGKLTAGLLKVCRANESEAGTRPLLVSRYGKLLEGFEMNDKNKVSSSVSGRYTIERDKGSKGFLFRSEGISVKAIPGASHYRIIFAAACASDMRYDKKEKKYLQAEASNGIRNKIVYSDVLPIDATNIDTELRLNIRASKGKSLVVCVGVEYYRFMNNKPELIMNKGGLRVERVITLPSLLP